MYKINLITIYQTNIVYCGRILVMYLGNKYVYIPFVFERSIVNIFIGCLDLLKPPKTYKIMMDRSMQEQQDQLPSHHCVRIRNELIMPSLSSSSFFFLI